MSQGLLLYVAPFKIRGVFFLWNELLVDTALNNRAVVGRLIDRIEQGCPLSRRARTAFEKGKCKKKVDFLPPQSGHILRRIGKNGEDDLCASGSGNSRLGSFAPTLTYFGTVPGVPPPGWDPEAKRREYAKGGFVFVYVRKQEVAGDNCGFSERGRRRELKCIDERREKMMNGDVSADMSAAIWGRPLARDGKEPGDEVRWKEERAHTCHSLTSKFPKRKVLKFIFTPLNPPQGFDMGWEVHESCLSKHLFIANYVTSPTTIDNHSIALKAIETLGVRKQGVVNHPDACGNCSF
ncbi:hypothetical protein CEXT_459731 [Caerostris extrusa]|uniref:Uncharacterized protein n=1 Tax=Caerostris extrusa TaxID=172846 RepID=A0AAV4QTD2_CAEEX|nr:hypothetical protein CEXT_459731 [Caerostris extrusa]